VTSNVQQSATAPSVPREAPEAAAPAPSIPQSFQIFLALYLLLTGSVPTIAQALAFGVQGNAGYEFTVAILSQVLRDGLLFAPVLVLSRQPLGILHPLLVAVVVWPALTSMPAVLQGYGGWAGVVGGVAAAPPHYLGLPFRSDSVLWMAIAKFNFVDSLRLIGIYAGFAIVGGAPKRLAERPSLPRPESVRRAMIVLVLLSLLLFWFFIRSRGGMSEHLASLGNGRFRELGGHGITLVAIHLAAIALYVWTAARPEDVKNPAFFAVMGLVILSQFVSDGSRSSALIVPMMVGLIWAFRTNKIPWRIALLLVPVLFLSVGILSAIRTSSWSNQTAGQVIENTDIAKSFALVQEEIDTRRALSAAVPVVTRGFEVTNGPLLGRSYEAALFAFVPRTVWAGKPRGPDSLYSQLFLRDSRYGQGIPVGDTGELYWNFGIAGVLLFSILFGWLLRQAYMFFWRRYPHPIAIVFYALVITGFRIDTEDLVRTQQQLLLLLICAAATWFAPRVLPANQVPGRWPAEAARGAIGAP
jgi:hypothetical protein